MPAPIFSAPRMRGKVRLCSPSFGRLRITPAGAGNRQARCSKAPLHRDHPRRCGEQHGQMRITQLQWGSPPQVRGTAKWFRFEYYIIRITPPRRCGEQLHIPQVFLPVNYSDL